MFAIKAEVSDPKAEAFAFGEQKTMYGGRHIAKGDLIFVFASENEGGPGLIASGIVTSAEAIPKKHGIDRQTPRVSITIRRTAIAKRRLGRSELELYSNWNDGRPETELNFKFYRQATNKIAGISDEAAAQRLSECCQQRLAADGEDSAAEGRRYADTQTGEALSESIDWRLAKPKENEMERTYFTDAEARTEVGKIVEALSDFPSVPKGTKGTVVKVNRHEKDKWAALVEWDLPRQSSFIAAMVLDVSLNFSKRSKPVTDEFSKSEYETLLRVPQPAN